MKLLVFLPFLAAVQAQAQYQIPWWTTDGGGGRSTGSVYSVTATVGQADAGAQSGGPYSLVGGFWSLVAAIQTEGAPTLRVTLDGPDVILAWPDPSTGFELQATSSLATPVWANVGQTPNVVGTEKQVRLPLQRGNQLFRLRKP